MLQPPEPAKQALSADVASEQVAIRVDLVIQSEASLQAAQAAYQVAEAEAQQIQILNREAAVMTFNNLFVVIAGFLALSLLAIPLLSKAKPNAGSGALH